MGKLIAKTALITLGALVALCLILWGFFAWLAPSLMVSITNGLGMDSACAHYSVSVYKKTQKIEDLALVVERNYVCGKFVVSAEYGELLLQHAGFSDYSARRDAEAGEQAARGYKQTLVGITSVSHYKTENRGRALELALINMDGKFLPYNAMEMLLHFAMIEGDVNLVREIRASVETIVLDESDAVGAAHREEVLAICDEFLNGK